MEEATTASAGDGMRIPYAACPLCSSVNIPELRRADCSHHPLFRSGIPATMRWLRCEDCRHVFVDGYFGEEALKILFSNTNAHQVPGQNLHGPRAVSARMIEKVVAVSGKPGGVWLDVGFGNGALLGTAQEYGYSPVGLDARQSSVELLRGFGIEAHATPFCEFRPERPPRVVSMADVLEHMPFPRDALRHAHDILTEDGVLFLSMPNSDAHIWHRFESLGTNPYWGELEHYHNFGRARLEALLVEHRFEPIAYSISERYYMCMELIARRLSD